MSVIIEAEEVIAMLNFIYDRLKKKAFKEKWEVEKLQIEKERLQQLIEQKKKQQTAKKLIYIYDKR